MVGAMPNTHIVLGAGPVGRAVVTALRSRGIEPTSNRARSVRNMVGPTLNQHPRLTARASSLLLPENQCKTGVPQPGSASNLSKT